MTPTITNAVLPATNSGITLQGSSYAEGSQVVDGNMPSSSFSALFKQLLEKTAAHEASAKLIDMGHEEIESPRSDEAQGALNALLPFLEAIGLTQETHAGKNPLGELTTTDDYQNTDTLTVLAGPITPQLSNAANIAEVGSISIPVIAGKDQASVTPSQVSASQDSASQVSASQVSASQVSASQVSASQVSASQVSASQVSASQVSAQSSAVSVETDRIELMPMRSDQLISEEAVTPSTDIMANQWDKAVGSQTLLSDTNTVAEWNKNGNQSNPVTVNPLSNTSSGEQSTQAVEHFSKMINISQPVGAASWDHEVGQSIVWMANRSEGKAELVLTPPQMGRIEVSLTVSGDQATASFASANPVVREALESALPRLREVLAEAGIRLGQTQVGAGNAHQSAQQEKNPEKFAAQPETSAEKSSIMASSDHELAPSVLKGGRGLVDVFA